MNHSNDLQIAMIQLDKANHSNPEKHKRNQRTENSIRIAATFHTFYWLHLLQYDALDLIFAVQRLDCFEIFPRQIDCVHAGANVFIRRVVSRIGLLSREQFICLLEELLNLVSELIELACRVMSYS